MAAQTIYVCDHCGRNFHDHREDFSIRIGDYCIEYELAYISYMAGEIEQYSSEYHICWPCIIDALRKFVEKENV